MTRRSKPNGKFQIFNKVYAELDPTKKLTIRDFGTHGQGDKIWTASYASGVSYDYWYEDSLALWPPPPPPPPAEPFKPGYYYDATDKSNDLDHPDLFWVASEDQVYKMTRWEGRL